MQHGNVGIIFNPIHATCLIKIVLSAKVCHDLMLGRGLFSVELLISTSSSTEEMDNFTWSCEIKNCIHKHPRTVYCQIVFPTNSVLPTRFAKAQGGGYPHTSPSTALFVQSKKFWVHLICFRGCASLKWDIKRNKPVK